MKKIAFVPPWYGDHIPGGAEMELREVAKHLHDAGADVEILTTCVKEFGSDWNVNFHKPGDSVSEAGIPVKRFPVRKRNTAAFDAVNLKIMQKQPVTSDEEDVFLREMINSPELYDYIRENQAEYTAFIYIPYMFGTTYYGVQACPEKAVLIPCFHDEGYAHFQRFREVFPQAAGMIYNARPEMELAENLYHFSESGTKTILMGIGMDTDISGNAERFRQKFGMDKPFILYAGRKDAGKNVPLLLQYFSEYKKRSGSDMQLVLIGGGDIAVPVDVRDSVHDLGFVDAQDKYDACAAALLLCQPSKNESFSLVIMESWLCGRPVLVHEDCAVTRNFASESNGGLYFRNYFEFEGCVEYLLKHPEIADAMGQNGRQYVHQNFSWDIITQKYLQFFENMPTFAECSHPAIACPSACKGQAVQALPTQAMHSPHNETMRASASGGTPPASGGSPHKIALVNQRYGLEVNGGSEYYTRLIAERLTPYYEVDVITTKALDYTTWENHYTADEETINGVHVLRFPTGQNRAKDFNACNADYLNRMANGQRDEALEAVWFEKQGPYAPSAIEYIRAHKDDYDAFLFVTYLYYLTVKGLPEVAEKAILIPTAHEEPFLHFLTYEKLFQLPKRFIFLTEEEKMLVQKLFRNEHIPSAVMGTGVEIPGEPDAERFRKKFGISSDYLIYVGRIDEGKDCPMLFRYFLEYKKRRPDSGLKLVLMGKAVCLIPEHPDIVSLGFMSEEDKFDGISGARALVLPSKFESLSISVLEAMALSVPVIVNGICEVLRGHCIRSNAGLYYRNYFEFEGITDYLLTHPAAYAQMKQNAKAYIAQNYEWDGIMQKFREVIETL